MGGLEKRFESLVLPVAARRAKGLSALLSELYLHGLTEGESELAMCGLLGEGAPLSTSSIRRLRQGWTQEFEARSSRSLADREVVYVWVDGIYVKVGLERDKAAVLVAIAALGTGRRRSWPSREAFAKRYRSWYPKAIDVLEDDWDRMVGFNDFPEAHWKHLRATNIVESPFASVRLRTSAATRNKKVESATALIWKLLTVAEKRFRRLDAPHLLRAVFDGRKFVDGEPVPSRQRRAAA